ncbi:transposase, partial [Tenacibaculum maritimum]|nr:transposase [Tenacibaculum maritimum]
MQLQQGDIIVKKSKGEDIFWLSERIIIEVCSITEDYLRKAKSVYKKEVPARFQSNEFLPDTGKSWRWAKTRNGFYYCYDNIPDRKPVYY